MCKWNECLFVVAYCSHARCAMQQHGICVCAIAGNSFHCKWWEDFDF